LLAVAGEIFSNLATSLTLNSLVGSSKNNLICLIFRTYVYFYEHLFKYFLFFAFTGRQAKKYKKGTEFSFA